MKYLMGTIAAAAFFAAALILPPYVHFLGGLAAVFCFYTFPSSSSGGNCSELIRGLKFPRGTVLLDPIVLKGMQFNLCIVPKRVVIGLPASQKLDDLGLEALSQFDVYLYESLSDGNYIKFYPVDQLHNPVRAFPVIEWRKVDGVLIPANIPQFLIFSKRSKLIGCRDIDMNRTEEPYIDPSEAVRYLVNLQNLLYSLDMYPFIVFGTLLGWYRECGIIPHTGDLDVSVMAEDYNPQLFDALYSKKHGFRLTRQFGRPNNNFELTIVPEGTEVWFTIDLFLMYNNGAEYWMGGTGNDGTRVHFTYPVYNEFCGADLYGHLFWVTCSPELMIQADYGKEWYKDKPTETFEWWNTPNARLAGKWAAHELNETVRIFEKPVFYVQAENKTVNVYEQTNIFGRWTRLL